MICVKIFDNFTNDGIIMLDEIACEVNICEGWALKNTNERIIILKDVKWEIKTVETWKRWKIFNSCDSIMGEIQDLEVAERFEVFESGNEVVV